MTRFAVAVSFKCRGILRVGILGWLLVLARWMFGARLSRVPFG